MSDINILPAAPVDAPLSVPDQATVEAARVRRDAIIADKNLADKYLKGDVAIVQEMRTLNMVIAEQATPDKLGAVLAGTATPGRFETITGSELPTSDLMSAVESLRKQGHSDHIIREIIEGTPVTPERHREAENLRERLLRDRGWLREYRSGSREHIEQMHTINAVIAAPIAEAKK